MKIVLYGGPAAGLHRPLADLLDGDHDFITLDYAAEQRQLEAAFVDADAVVTVRYDAKLPSAPRLRLVQVPGAGCDEIDLTALPVDATLCNVYNHEQGVAEYAVLAMLQWCHRFMEAHNDFRDGSWSRSSRFGAPPHEELAGKTVGIVGYGRIGRALAKRLVPFEVSVQIANRTEPPVQAEIASWYPLSQLDEMLARCDFLIVCLALTPETKGLIKQQRFTAMRPNAVLVNVARGPVVDEGALYDALTKGLIGGAIIDVWYQYPDADHPNVSPSRYDFASLPNVYMTPHISGWTTGTVQRRVHEIADNLNRLVAGRSLINVVHRSI